MAGKSSGREKPGQVSGYRVEYPAHKRKKALLAFTFADGLSK